MRGVEVDGELIRRLRTALGQTQGDLAAKIECDEKTVRKAESGGRVDLRVAVAIASQLECDPLLVMKGAPGTEVQVQRNKQLVLAWQDAYSVKDLDRVLSLHHDEGKLDFPGSEGLPAGGQFEGIEQIRQHHIDVFAMFDFVRFADHQQELHAVDDMAFLRTTATFRFVATGKEFTSRYLNEFQFKDGRILIRRAISDLTGLHESCKTV